MTPIFRNCVLILSLTAGACPLLAVADPAKTFSFENPEAFHPGPLKMYLERTHCILDPQSLSAEFGTPEAPRQIQSRQRATARVMPAPEGPNCTEKNGGSSFTVRFFKEATVDLEIQGMPPRVSTVTFSLGKNSITGIDNQGAGALLLDHKGPEEAASKEARYAVDWLPLTVARKDVVYSDNGELEVSVQCKNSRRRACQGRLQVSSRTADFGAGLLGAPVLLARGAFKIPFNEVKSVPLKVTKAGKALLVEGHDSPFAPTHVTVELSAHFGGKTVSLATASLPSLASAGQGAQKSLSVINNASSSVSACLYQQPQLPGLLPTVWFASHMAPGVRRTFRWSDDDYSFVWSEIGPLRPGVVFSPSQVISAAAGSQITLTTVGGNPQFSEINPSASPLNRLSVISSAAIAPESFGIGVGLSGIPVFVAQAQPNQVTQFPIPSRAVYLFAGDCVVGEVLDPQALSNVVMVSYDRQTQATATLQANGTWNVVMGAGP